MIAFTWSAARSEDRDGPPPGRAYIPTADGTSVSVIDTATDRVIATIPVDAGAIGVALHPAGTHVYVTSHASGSLSVISTATNAVVATIPLGPEAAEPMGVAVSPDGSRVYVADVHDGSVSVVDTARHAVIATFPAGSFLLGATVNPAGTRLYLSNDQGTDVAVVDTGSNTRLGGIAVGGPSYGVAVSPDGALLYVTLDVGELAVVDTASDSVVATVTLGAHPRGVAVAPDSARVYVANSGSDTVSVVDTASNTVIATVPVGTGPGGVAVTPDGRRAYVVNSGGGDVSVLDLSTDTVSATVTVPAPASVLGVFVGPVASALDGSESTNPSITSPASPTSSARSIGSGGAGGSSGLGSPGSAGASPASARGLQAGPQPAGPLADGGNPAAPNGTITGTVTRSDNNAVLQGVTIDVFDVASGAFVAGSTTLTDVNGIYTTIVLAPGAYRIRARLSQFANTWFSSGRSFNDGTVIIVTAGASSIADIAMAAGGGITGTVTNAANVPQGGITIDVFDFNNNNLDTVTSAAGTGAYTFQRRLAPGAYKVRARGVGFVTTFNSQRHTFPTADLVMVQAGADIIVDFTLEAGSNITGTVTDAFNNAVSGAIIDIYEAEAFNFVEGGFVTSGTGAYGAQSRLPAGKYVIRARRSGSASNVAMTFFSSTGGKRGFDTAEPVTVGTAQIVGPKDIQMDVPGSLTGTVTDGVNPIPGAQVDIIDASPASSTRHNFLQFAVRTDASGVFNTGSQFSTAGSYKIRVRAPGRIDAFYHAGADLGLDLFTATPLSSPSVANVTVTADGTIKGTIRERGTNLPLPGIPVNTFRFAASALSGAFTVLTDLNGNYTIGGLHDGEWVVRADAPDHINAYYSGNADNPATDMQTATPVVISGGGIQNNVSINLATGGGTIRGLVTRQDNGQPIPAGGIVQLRLYPRMAFILNAQISSFNLCPGAPTPCNFSVPNQLPGDYALEAFGSAFESDTAIGWYQMPVAGALGRASRGTALPVTIASTATANFQVPTPAGSARTISGLVKDSNGVPLTGAQIGAFDPANTSSSRFVNLNADGSFFLNHLPPGKYVIRADTEKDYIASVYGLDTTNGLPGQPYAEPLLTGGALIDVTAGDAADLEIRMPGSPGTIAGKVTRVSGGTLVGIMGASVSIQNFFGNGVFGATTRADGSYLVRSLTPGAYKVRMSAPGPGFITRFYRCDNPPCATSTGTGLSFEDGSFVTVAAGQQVSSINVTLDPGGGSITGTVLGPGNVPVAGALVQAREAASGATVFTTVSATDGTYSILQLATGNYKLRVFSNAPGFVAQWYNGKLTREESDPVSVTAPNTTPNVDFLVATNEGSFSGQVFGSNGVPVPGAGIAAFDTTGGLVRGAGVAGRDGKYSMVGLAPGTYIAQARGLGYASTFFGQVPDVATASPIVVQSDTPGINITMQLDGDVTGTISYVGQQTGTVHVGLYRFIDGQGCTNTRLYNATLPAPGPFKFRKPAPDTQGVLPTVAPNKYCLRAFIDSNPNGVQDASEAHGEILAAIVVGAGAVTAGQNIVLVDGANLGTTTTAETTQVIIDPQPGNPAAALQDTVISIIENATATLGLSGRIQVTLPQGLTFVGMPSVSEVVSNGLQVCTGGANGPLVDMGGQRFSFAICQQSSSGPATLAITSIVVNVPSGFVPDGPPCPVIDPPSTRVCVNVNASAPNGLTGAALSIASFVPPSPVAVLSDVSIAAVGQGVTNRQVVLTGQNFDLLDFGGPNPDTIVFGIDGVEDPNIQVTNITVDNPNQITITIDVAPNTSLVGHDVIITETATATRLTLSDVVAVDPPPTLTSAGTGGSGTGPLFSNVTSQTVIIKGTNIQSPPGLNVSFSGSGVTVKNIGVSLDAQTQTPFILATVDVAKDAELGGGNQRVVTVTNPDGGSVTGSCPGQTCVAVTAPPADAPVGAELPATVGTSTAVIAPSISGINPPSARTGVFVTITGTGFSTTPSANAVSFAGPNNTRISAGVPAVLTGPSLSVQVPSSAVDGPVIVAVSGVQSSNSFNFTVTNPRLSAVTPSSVVQGDTGVLLQLTGAKFAAGAKLSINPSTNLTIGQLTITPTSITASMTVGATAGLGLRDVTVTNPDGSTATIPQALEIRLKSTAQLALTLKTMQDVVIDLQTFLPSVNQVLVSLDATGKCTAKSITPTPYLLEARFTTPPATLPPTLTFTLTSSNLPGTATNEDCELPNPLQPAPDWSIEAVGANPNVTTQQVAIALVAGVYKAVLASWDWGGDVRIVVTNNPNAPTVQASLTLPIDIDKDKLPDVYEKDGVLNTNGVGNVLDHLKGDVNNNGILDGLDKFATDGLTNFEKYRGVYLAMPVKGSVNAAVPIPAGGITRLGAGMRNFFVRGHGFRNDPNMPAGTCGVNSQTGAPQPADLPAGVPCPEFQVGDAFKSIGILVRNVAASFSATTEFPTKSLADPTKRMLDMATVTFDTLCKDGTTTTCAHTFRVGPRNWAWPNPLAFSTFGSSTTYGIARVYARALKAYFTDRPYKHQENLAGKYLPAGGGAPMLAPISIVCDKASGGPDDGKPQSGECLAGGVLGGDVYDPLSFNQQLSAVDVNNDGCVELPLMADPTKLTPCDKTAATAPFPQATFQLVITSLVTHELGHAAGVNIHTTDQNDIMYNATINWTRAGRFSPEAAALVQVHNKGLQK